MAEVKSSSPTPVARTRVEILLSETICFFRETDLNGEVLQVHRENVSGQVGGSVIDPLEWLESTVAMVKSSDNLTFEEIHLFLDDADIIYQDNRDTKALQGTWPDIAEFAAQTLCRPEAAYCYLPFGESSQREEPRRLFAFMDADRLRAYLLAMGELALKVRVVAPALFPLLISEAKEGKEIIALVDMKRDRTVFSLFHSISGAAFSHSIDVGWNNIIESYMLLNNRNKDEAIDALARNGDLFFDLQEKAGALAQNQSDDIYRDAESDCDLEWIARLEKGVEEAIGFFSYQKMSGFPKNLLVRSMELPCLNRFFESAFGLACEPQNFIGKTQALSSGELGPSISFLTGAPEALVRWQDKTYGFVDGMMRPLRAAVQRQSDDRSADSLAEPLERLARFWQQLNGAGKAASVVGAICLIAVMLTSHHMASSHERSVARYAESFEFVEVQSSAAEHATGITASISNASQIALAAELAEMAQVLPRAATLTRIAKHEEDLSATLQISGAMQESADQASELASFIEGLRQVSGPDAEVNLLETQLGYTGSPSTFVVEVNRPR